MMASICQHFDTSRELKFSERVKLPIKSIIHSIFLHKWTSNITNLPLCSILDSDKAQPARQDFHRNLIW